MTALPDREREVQLSHARLLELLHYDPETGIFTRRTRHLRSKYCAGDVAGYDNGLGVIIVAIEGRKYVAHRLAWFYSKATWPAEFLDHRDLNCSNNRLDNLREATKPQNSANRGAAKNNKSGVKGVFWSLAAKKWCAQICVNGKRMHLGVFAEVDAAGAAYAAAAKKHFGEFARHE